LKNRVRSYFNKNQNYKTQKLVENISSIEFVLTDNESEAFLLESNMIKKYRPKFNIELKDQQRYTYLRISDEKFPRLLVSRRTRDGKFLGKGKTFGPFTQGSSKLLTIGTLRKAFQIRICKTLPKKVCLEYHLGNCEGPCEFKDAQEKYPKHVNALQDVLKGKNQTKIFTKKLEEEMQQAAESQQFERAKDIRDIRDSDKFFFDLVGDNSFSNFLYQYYSTHKIPKLILVSELPENKKLLELLLSEQSGHNVQILCPSKGKKKDIINLILKNIKLILSKGGDPGLVELKEILRLSVIPNIIECFDISNHGEDFAVGSMSRFVGGIPNKSGYRKFKIKTVSGRDDFAMIGEIIKRRYYRLLEENSELPDLIVIDGGKGQLSSAMKSLESLGLDLPCISLAKENEEVYLPKHKNPIVIPKYKSSLKILQHARDETHRFGVAYNRTIRKNQIK